MHKDDFEPRVALTELGGWDADPLLLGLSTFGGLSEEEGWAVERLSRGPLRNYRGRRDIIREGDRPRHPFAVVSGWACRYKTLPDGRRQIISILLPGDVFGMNCDLGRRFDHAVGSLTPLQICELNPTRLQETMTRYPRLRDAFRWREAVDVAIVREWVLNTGQRNARERIAHLVCELFSRLRVVRHTTDNLMHFPITQSDLADATGLTPVHVNRTMKELRTSGLIQLQAKLLTIPDFDALKDAGLFTSDYLYLGGSPERRSVFSWR